jgi:hypothetical protein
MPKAGKFIKFFLNESGISVFIIFSRCAPYPHTFIPPLLISDKTYPNKKAGNHAGFLL